MKCGAPYRFGVWLSGGGVLAFPGLLTVLAPLPRPVTVMRSTTLRLPANDCAMRFAVTFSLPVGTEPESSMVSPFTFAITFEVESVGSAFSALPIFTCKPLPSDALLLKLPAALESDALSVVAGVVLVVAVEAPEPGAEEVCALPDTAPLLCVELCGFVAL